MCHNINNWQLRDYQKNCHENLPVTKNWPDCTWWTNLFANWWVWNFRRNTINVDPLNHYFTSHIASGCMMTIIFYEATILIWHRISIHVKSTYTICNVHEKYTLPISTDGLNLSCKMERWESCGLKVVRLSILSLLMWTI